jgi:hypothetical protein
MVKKIEKNNFLNKNCVKDLTFLLKIFEIITLRDNYSFLPTFTTLNDIFSYLPILYVRNNQKSAQASPGEWRNFPFSRWHYL